MVGWTCMDQGWILRFLAHARTSCAAACALFWLLIDFSVTSEADLCAERKNIRATVDGKPGEISSLLPRRSSSSMRSKKYQREYLHRIKRCAKYPSVGPDIGLF